MLNSNSAVLTDKIFTLRENSGRKIAQIVGASIATISRVVKIKSDTGNILPKHRGKCGRKSKTTSRDNAN